MATRGKLVPCLAALVAACGGSVVVDAGSGASSGGATGGAAGGSLAASTGTGGGSPGCPEAQPPDASSCKLGAHCAYGDTQCHCYAIFPGWICKECPPTLPSGSDAVCMPHTANCVYGAAQCVCFGGGPWECAECPPSAPSGPCDGTLTGLACDYGATHCECFSGAWTCS